MGLRRLGTILLLSLTILYTFGLFAVYVWDSIAIKQSMKAAIAAGTSQSNEVSTIIINLQQVTPAEVAYWQQDEISIDNKMYDVVSTCKQQDKLVIKCICDENENLLIATYKRAVEKTQSNSTGKNSSGHKTLFSPFTINSTGIIFSPLKIATASALIEHRTAFAQLQSSGVLTPPPRRA
jgi:hypothetical protein